MCMIDDGEHYDVFTGCFRYAAKSHACEECRREIAKGEQYSWTKGLFERKWYEHRTCLHCYSGQSLLMAECGGYMHGGLEDDLAEHINEALPWSRQAARLVVGMRRKWLRFDGAALMAVPAL